MDTSSPAAFVTAEFLSRYVGQKVRAVLQVIQSDGGVTTGKSTDGLELTVKGLPSVPPMSYVEVIGIAEGNQAINANTWTNFGTSFDPVPYNQLCQLANGEFRNLFL